jgi:hypothetical protein
VFAGVGLWSRMPSTMKLRIITLSSVSDIVKLEYVYNDAKIFW